VIADAIRRAASAIRRVSNALGARAKAIAGDVVTILTVSVAIRCFADAFDRVANAWKMTPIANHLVEEDYH